MSRARVMNPTFAWGCSLSFFVFGFPSLCQLVGCSSLISGIAGWLECGVMLADSV